MQQNKMVNKLKQVIQTHAGPESGKGKTESQSTQIESMSDGEYDMLFKSW